MALNTAALTAQLTSLFTSPPDNIAGCASAWASAMQSYSASIVPASTTVSAAATALESALAAAFVNNGSPSMLATMEAAFASFAATVGGGMTGFTATPPPGPVGFASIGTQADNATAASTWTTDINSWMITGLAAQITPPLPPVPWS